MPRQNHHQLGARGAEVRRSKRKKKNQGQIPWHTMTKYNVPLLPGTLYTALGVSGVPATPGAVGGSPVVYKDNPQLKSSYQQKHQRTFVLITNLDGILLFLNSFIYEKSSLKTFICLFALSFPPSLLRYHPLSLSELFSLYFTDYPPD